MTFKRMTFKRELLLALLVCSNNEGPAAAVKEQISRVECVVRFAVGMLLPAFASKVVSLSWLIPQRDALVREMSRRRAEGGRGGEAGGWDRRSVG